MRQARWMGEMCARQRARELLQASWRRVEVAPPRRACHVTQATGGRVPRIGKRETALPAQASVAVRSDVAQHCRSRGDLERRNVMSVVVHGSKPDLLRIHLGTACLAAAGARAAPTSIPCDETATTLKPTLIWAGREQWRISLGLAVTALLLIQHKPQLSRR